MSVSSHLRPVALPLSSLQLRLQSLHVRPVDVRPVALTLVSSATQKILAVQADCCPQVAVALHAWPVSSVWLFFSESKRQRWMYVLVNFMYAPWPPSIVSSPTPKRTCSAWRLLSYRTQAMGSLSVCSSTEICGCKCHERHVGPPLVFSATQKNTCSASRWLSLHVPPVASVFLFFNWKQTQFNGESKRQTCSECSSAVT